MCQMKVEYVQKFLDFLCEKITSASAPTLLLQSTAAYIGSFVGRATFIPEAIVLVVLSKLLTWLHSYISAHNSSVPDAQQHALFYSICQSAVYIFCFKCQNLSSDHQQSILMSFKKIIYCSLNPLKLLLVDVVQEFSDICSKLGVPDPQQIMTNNKRIALPTKSVYGGPNEIETFFPFDPYLLKQSSRHFKGAYQFWKTAPVEEDSQTTDLSDVSPSPPNSPLHSQTRRRASGLSLSCDQSVSPLSLDWDQGAYMGCGSFDEEQTANDFLL